MSKVVRCREVGVDCDFEARAETEQEVLQQCAEHAKSAHGMDQIPADLAAKVPASIHDEEPRQSAASAI
jgi:predicted small metal-binding protein